MARKSRKNLNAVIAPRSGNEVVLQEPQSTEPIRMDGLATAAYVRLSVENNGHETDDSLKTQIALVESYIREHDDLYLMDTYVDNGVSGARFDRPG